MNSNIPKSLSILEQRIRSAPHKPGIYRMVGSDKEILYIGKAKDLKKRLKQYSNFNKLSYRIKIMVSQISDIETIQTTSEIEALILELNLIKTEKPKYNILLTDDKTFPYIYISTHDSYPRIYSTRNKNLEGKYFGPYAGAFDVHTTIDLLKKSFLIRGCTNSEFRSRTKPCLEYQIKRCSAPCVKYISEMSYKSLVSDAMNFLKGKNLQIKQNLINQMEDASKKMSYETAAILRDRIKALTTIISKQSVSDHNLDSSDVVVVSQIQNKVMIEVCFFRNGLNHGSQKFFPKNSKEYSNREILTEFIKQFYGAHNLVKEIITNEEVLDKENIISLFKTQYDKHVKFTTPKTGRKKEILDFIISNINLENEEKLRDVDNNEKTHQKLAEIFDLDKTPNKIELFDNSHISGKHAIGAMVVVSQQGFLKTLYRKFNIKSVLSAGDDYAMLKEVLFRRYSKLKQDDPNNKNGSWPDLILIDGGKGQAKIASQVLSYLDISIPFFCIAKGKERNKGKERFCNIEKDYFVINNKEILYYLQRVRDEVHRFVITSHRKKRDKNSISSELDTIPGIGTKRKKILLQHFGSVAKIKAMSAKDLQSAPTISENIAKIIKEYLH